MPEAQQAAPWIFYSSVGLIILTPFLFQTTALFVVSLIGFIYPTFASAVAIYKHDETLIGQWLSYWVVYGGFLTIQKIFGVLLWKIPFYPLFQALFLIALMHYPVGDHHTLAKYFFWMYLAKYFGEAAVEANEAIVEVAAEIREDPQGFAEQLMNGNENRGNHAAAVEHNALFIVEPTGNSEDSQEEAGRDVSCEDQTLSATSATEASTRATEASTRATEAWTRASEESTRGTEESTRGTEESTRGTESTMITNQVAKRLAELHHEATSDTIQSHTVTDQNNNNADDDYDREEASPSSSNSTGRLDVYDVYDGYDGMHGRFSLLSSELLASNSEEDSDVDVEELSDVGVEEIENVDEVEERENVDDVEDKKNL